jgi:hypothetical protein
MVKVSKLTIVIVILTSRVITLADGAVAQEAGVVAVLNKVMEAQTNIIALRDSLSTKWADHMAKWDTQKNIITASSLKWRAHDDLLDKIKALQTDWASQQENLGQKSWASSDQKLRPIWRALITKTIQSLAGRSEIFKKTMKTVMKEKILSWGSTLQDGRDLKEILTIFLSNGLEITNEDMSKTPTRESYDAFRSSINDLKEVTAQRLLTKEVDENEEMMKTAKEKAETIQIWSYITLSSVLLILLFIVISFSGWFCYVCKRTQEDREELTRSQRERTERRNLRESEGRIAGHVAHELVPLAVLPSAPPLQAARFM